MGEKIVNKQTPEEKAAEERAVADRRAEATGAILASLDLPPDKTPEQEAEAREAQETENKRLLETPEEKLTPEDRSQRAVLEKQIATEKPDLTEKELLEIPDEDLTEEGIKIKKEILAKQGTDDDDDGDGDLIPKSKVAKRIKGLTTEVKDLRDELRQVKADRDKSRDPDLVKLENKTIPELRDLKRKTKRMVLKEQDDEKVDALLELESKIDECILNAPQRFKDKQVDLYTATIKSVADELDIDPKGEEGEKIRKIAANIFASYPKLQMIDDGMAMALKLAVEHYKVTSKSSTDDDGKRKLKSDLSKLKKRTTLDSNLLKKSKKTVHLSRLRDRARGPGSTMIDKAALVKDDPLFNIDSLIPEEFRGK